MSKTVNRVWLASLLLLICGIGSCSIGQRQWERELEKIHAEMKASGFYVTHLSPDTNAWQVIGFLLFFASLSFGLAAFLLGKQDK